MEHEFVTIPPFHRLPIAAQGSIGYVLGNVPYIAYSEGIDDMRILQGQTVPCKANRAELINPFSFAAKVQILRGGQIDISAGSLLWPERIGLNLCHNRSGALLLNVASGGDGAGRRRGIGIIPKRGVYAVDFVTQSSGTNLQLTEIMILPKASWQFIGLRPGATFANTVNLVRPNGRKNEQLVSIAGSYTQAEIDTWKASVGYSGSEIKSTCSAGGVSAQIDSETAVFYTFDETVTARIDLQAVELGDVTSRVREV